MLRVKLNRETVKGAVEYYVQENEGLTPILEDDADLLDWFRYVLGTDGRGPEELAAVELALASDEVVLAVPRELADVLDTVRRHVL